MARDKFEVLLKKWDDFSAGIGYASDDGRTPGLYHASGLIGLRGELRVGPRLVAGTAVPYIAHTLAWAFSVSPAAPPSGEAVSIKPNTTAGVTIGNKYKSTTATNTTCTIAAALPATTLNKRILLVLFAGNGTANATGVTYNGTALTLLGRDVAGAIRAELYYIKEADLPATGNAVITYAGACDIVGFAQWYDNVDQTTANWTSNGCHGLLISDSGPLNMYCTTASTNDHLVGIAAWPYAVTAYNEPRQTSRDSDSADTQITAEFSYRTVSNVTTDFQFQYFFDDQAIDAPYNTYLYGLGGYRIAGLVALSKYKLTNTNFADAFTSGVAQFPSNPGPLWPGQCARYKGYWYVPYGNDSKFRKLTISAVTDTLATTATPFVPGADHLVNLEDQVAGYVRQGATSVPGLGGVGTNSGGIRILKVDGDILTAADWGSAFPVGDRNDYAGALVGLSGLSFVLHQEGLYSFNKDGRSRLVFEDFRRWRGPFRNIPTTTWRGMILYPHPSGLLAIEPGSLPVNIGLETRQDLWSLPPSLAPALHGGRYHSAVSAGTEYFYAVYQPDPSSTSALLLCAYMPRIGTSGARAFSDIVYQCLETISIPDKDFALGVHVAMRGNPVSTSYESPTLWVQDNTLLRHVKLDARAGPFLSRATPQAVQGSGDAYMSEIVFDEREDLTRFFIIVQDMDNATYADEWQLSVIFNEDDTDTKLGPVIRTSGLHEVKVNRKGVYRLMLHVAYTSSDSSSSRVPPSVALIELYGRPSRAV